MWAKSSVMLTTQPKYVIVRADFTSPTGLVHALSFLGLRLQHYLYLGHALSFCLPSYPLRASEFD